ncbi:hypothetical protein J437_LFUL010833 [Ladona fulva]|uniref:Uncharacterized protein n=1 Tax=Ladona fulva TaxID=123851 RepID=A0A8K0KAS8_LADFU|nr:hypothetical protein J437_LFUL010833 [Ladona fulva]
MDSCNNLGKLLSKRTKSLSASEENEPSPKRTKHGSSVGETIDEESKSRQASETGRVQKSKSKEKDVSLEVTEVSSSTSRRTLRGNKSTSSAAVSEGVLKKNASKINKNTASPEVAPSEKDNGKATDAKSAKMEDISKIQEQKSKSLKKDLSVNEVKRITRKTSVNKGGDSEEKSHKKEIPLKNKGKVEKVVGRVTRRRQ